jgi:hypothetical protein
MERCQFASANVYFSTERQEVEPMRESAALSEGVYLSSLGAGSTIDLETRSRRYRIEYLEGDRVRISGHPRWCPTPTLARLCGSRGGSDGFAAGYIGCRMRLVFERLDDHIPVTTSEVTDIRVTNQN